MAFEDEKFMQIALREARRAAKKGEVPIGACIVCNGKVIAKAHNTRETKKNALHHAEVLAINKACKKLGGWRLFMCELYVTLEPCPMCAGAIVNSRIRRVVFGAADEKAGAFGTRLDMNSFGLNHRPEVQSGVCAEECRSVLKDFFCALREKRRIEK